jgi:tetratricopeptide (TPR) repeat protein
VHASNAARFKQAYRDIATKVDLPGRDDPKVDILRLVYNWLCDERNGRWLMVVDNADDDRVLSSPGTEPGGVAHASEHLGEATSLASFLPQARSGWLLVTSRNLLTALNLVGRKYNVIQVEPMTEEDALRLLKTRIAVSKSSEGDARALVQALEGIPLAVTHAASYVAIREPRINVSTYLELYRESEENQTYLLNIQNARDLRRDSSVSDTVITTWQLSFEHIRKTSPAAADLLSLMTMFDRQGVPEHLLYDGRSRLQFEDAVTPLTSFSLIRTQGGNPSRQQTGDQSFEMHSLVQLSTRKWLELNDEVGKWRKASLRIMAATFPNGQHETWASCQKLLPHSKKVLGYSSGCEEETLDQASIAINTARYLSLLGEYELAGNINRSALKAREAMLGPEHPDTLISVSQLGSVLEMQGKYDEAEAMHRRVLAGSEAMLEPEHPDTLTSVSQLGSVLRRQGKYDEAEAMHRRALAGRNKVLGPEHPHALISISKLGSALKRQGKYDEAEAMHRRALAGSEKVLGPEHPDTLISVSQLGSMLKSQGKYDEAEAMHRRVLAGSKKVLGPEHPHTLTSVSNLGSMLERQGKYDEAEAMNRRALAGSEKVLGPEHPDTLTSVSHLGSVLERQGKYDEAEAMHRRALAGREKVLGPEHPYTLHSVYHLAVILHRQQQHDAAYELYQRAYNGYTKTLGSRHPTTIACYNHYSSMDRKRRQTPRK